MVLQQQEQQGLHGAMITYMCALKHEWVVTKLIPTIYTTYPYDISAPRLKSQCFYLDEIA